MIAIRSILRTAGSLWFAGLLLVLLLVAMACATIVESLHGTERALATFYRAWWFHTLLFLLCANVVATLFSRVSFSTRKLGFVLTHVAILVTLGGALLTHLLGIEGQVAVTEGETVRFFNLPRDRLTIVNRRNDTSAAVDLTAAAFRGSHAVDHPPAPALQLGQTQVRVERFLPHSAWVRRVTEDSDPTLKPAVEVSLSASGQQNVAWVIADQPAGEDATSVLYRVFDDAAQLERAVSGRPPSSQAASVGLVRGTVGQTTHEIPLEDCTDRPVPLGETGYTVRVLQYQPHAIVGPDGRLTAAQDGRDNPAIIVELAGPTATVRRIAFAKFPGFAHADDELADVKLTFVAAENPEPIAPLEILEGPDHELYVRFQLRDRPVQVTPLTVGAPADTPWPGWKFTVLRRFGHARVEELLEPRPPLGEDRSPGLLLKISTPEQTIVRWVQKHQPRTLLIDGTPVELTYADQRFPLGFALQLDQLHVGTYPGETMPRSYESEITTLDDLTGREQRHVVSMNHPAEHGGYTFYQLRMYEQEGRSVLGVSRDSGQPIVFTGYVLLLLGMAFTLGTRIVEQRRATRRRTAIATAETGA